MKAISDNREISDDIVLERILERLREQGKTDKQLVEHLGLSNGAVTKWKHQGSRSYMSRIGEIAKFCGVSTDYLLHGTLHTGSNELSDVESEIITMYRELDPTGRECVLEILRRFGSK